MHCSCSFHGCMMCISQFIWPFNLPNCCLLAVLLHCYRLNRLFLVHYECFIPLPWKSCQEDWTLNINGHVHHQSLSLLPDRSSSGGVGQMLVASITRVTVGKAVPHTLGGLLRAIVRLHTVRTCAGQEQWQSRYRAMQSFFSKLRGAET